MGRVWRPLSLGHGACVAVAVSACVFALFGLAIGSAGSPPSPSLRDAQPGVGPSNPAPDLLPMAAFADPGEPREGQVVVVRFKIDNRGGLAAETATVDVFDDRPSGSTVRISRLGLPAPLESEASVVLSSDPFFAVEVGEHTVRIRIGNVSPAETSVEDNELAFPLTVRPAANTSQPPPDGNPDGFDFGVGTAAVTTGFTVATVVVLIGFAAFLLRPRRPSDLEPPPPEPPDRSPPPLRPP